MSRCIPVVACSLVRLAPGFVLLGALALPAAAEIYKSVDENGRITYSNVPSKGAKKLDLEPLTSVPMPKAKPRATGAAPGAVDNTTPADFPRVDSETQKKRDTTRRGILEEELRSEEKMLEEARRAYDEGSRTLKLGEESKNSPKYLERMARLKDGVTTHENNIQAVRRELSNLK